MKRKRVFAIGLGMLGVSGLLGYGCSSTDSGGGNPATGGSSNNSGGSANTGGTTDVGGTPNTGGTPASGGSTSNGGTPNTGGTATTGAGGTTGTGGATVADSSTPTGTGGARGTGGSVGAGGTTGLGGTTGTGGVATGTGGAPPVIDSGSPGVVCPSGISSNVTPCTTSCGPKTCGLADTGFTNCNCTNSVYVCTKCAFNPSDPNAPPFIVTPPTALCGTDSFDKAPCTTKGQACLCPAIVAGAAPAPCQTGASSTTKQQECACWPAGASQTLQWDCDTQPGL